MDNLKQLEKQLIEAAGKLDVAKKLAQATSAEYDVAYAKWKEDNPNLVDRFEQSQKGMKDANEAFNTLRTEAIAKLSELTDPDDMKTIDSFGYRREKAVSLDDDLTLVEVLSEIGAHGLLLPNRKLLTLFVKANAVKAGDKYVLPAWLLDQYKHTIGVNTEIKPTISNVKLAAKAETAYDESVKGN